MDPVRRGVGIAVLAQGGALAVTVLTGAATPTGATAGLGYGLVCDVLIVGGLVRGGAARVGIANGVTWARCVLVGAVVALVAGPAGGRATVELVVVAAVALVLDGVDGRVARTTGTVSVFGSRFDMEVDASLVLALSVAAAPDVGWWVLLIGSARYLLLAATLVIPALAEPTPPRLWRKVVAVAQGVALVVVCAGILEPPADEAIALAAAVALAWSFGTQVHGLLSTGQRAAPPLAEPVDARRG